jgi:hypothetical protein
LDQWDAHCAAKTRAARPDAKQAETEISANT